MITGSLQVGFIAALALAVCGCQTSQPQPAPSLDEGSIYRPVIERKADGLYYAIGETKPYTGKHEAWYADGTKAWEGVIKEGVRDGQYTQWHPSEGGKHLSGVYREGSRDGQWVQWYPGGQEEMTSKFNLGKETEAAFFDEQGAPISESLYMSRLQQRQFELQLNNLKLGNIQFSTSGGSSSSYSRNSSRGGYQSFGYTGGGSVRDYHNSSIGSSKSSGGTDGGRSLGTPEGSDGGKPGSP